MEYTIDNYEKFVWSRLSDISKTDQLGTCAAGLAGEIPELITEIQKLWGFVEETNTFMFRTEYKEVIKAEVIKELGDVCFYVAVGLNHFNLSFSSGIEASVDPYQKSLLDDMTRCILSGTALVKKQGFFCDLIKKVKYQGKPLEDYNAGPNNSKLISYLNDIVYELKTIAILFDTSLEEVINANIEKLSKRYPTGFSVINSEIRKEG